MRKLILYIYIYIYIYISYNVSLSGGSDNKESACNAGDLGLIPGLEKPPGEGNNYPLQYSCLENSRDRGTWPAQRVTMGHKGSKGHKGSNTTE